MTMTHPTPSARPLAPLVEQTLRAYASAPAAREGDAGPAILAALACELGMASDDAVDLALERWVEQLATTVKISGRLGLYGGLSGLLLGAHAVAPYRAWLEPLVARLQHTLERRVAASPWQREGVAWPDYDLVSGPAGIVLAATIVDPHAQRGLATLAAGHLAALCERDGLGGMRIGGYRNDELLGWNHGRINTGLAHGVGGVIAGLTRAVEVGPPAAAGELAAALRRACRWLADESYVDARGLHTWSPAGREGGAAPVDAIPPQAWCYGTPGLAWVLWDAGRTLDDRALMERAEDAMRSYCATFDDGAYLGHVPDEEILAVCHGAAGILAIADAFGLHAGLAEAAELAESLEGLVEQRLDREAAPWMPASTLLGGASGILAVLATRAGGSRSWLPALALR